MHDLLPRQLSKRCAQQATELQTGLGAARDMAQTCLLLAKLDVYSGALEFLRGVAIGAPGPQASAG